jgi:hypothetical protein
MKTADIPILDEVLKIKVSDLTQHGFLKEGSRQKRGTLFWYRNEIELGSIAFTVSLSQGYSFIELDYEYNGGAISYPIQLQSVASNLGKGVIWYFICPLTGLRCRKLYLGGSHFYHRSAFKGCMYERQTQSKRYRELEKIIGAVLQVDLLRDQMHKKYFKRQYAGKATKRFLKLHQKIVEYENLILSISDSGLPI